MNQLQAKRNLFIEKVREVTNRHDFPEAFRKDVERTVSFNTGYQTLIHKLKAVSAVDDFPAPFKADFDAVINEELVHASVSHSYRFGVTGGKPLGKSVKAGAAV